MSKQQSSLRGRLPVLLIAVVIILLLFARVLGNVLPRNQTGNPTKDGGNVNAATYPKTGHAPDYSWVAGQVQFTKIQGGCIYVSIADTPSGTATTPVPTVGIGTPIVGTSVRNDVSPPLSEMTPVTPSAQQPTIGDKFIPGGSGWDLSKVKDGDYVVMLGHVARADEPREMCPGGTQYIADKVLLNQ